MMNVADALGSSLASVVPIASPNFKPMNLILLNRWQLLRRNMRHGVLAMALLLALLQGGTVRAADAPQADAPRLVRLGAGDSVTLQVYGQPEMGSTVYVADSGTISVPLAGPVQVAGLTPVEAEARVEKALKDGQFLVDPHVTLTVTQSLSQRVSVLGEVRNPGRYNVDPNTTILDVLAQAGGMTETSADFVYLLRPDGNGGETRHRINLKGLSGGTDAAPTLILKASDSILVPHADQFYIYGEVARPDKYRIEPGMTVLQAIAGAGGITPRGSERRVEIKRVGKDGRYIVKGANPGDLVLPDDVIRVKESIF